MPCMSYEPYDRPSVDTGKALRDKLARIACKALTELERLDPGNDLFYQDTELNEWWTQHKIDDAAAEAKRREAAEAKAKRKAALAKLTDEEKKILGVK